MDAQFWLERWQQSQIGFHQADINAQLQQHWSAFDLSSNSSVFVPLCGKSLDMVWLAGQGHHVIGIELSQIAIDEFFASQNLVPETKTVGQFTVKSAGPYQLWCGDIFSLPHGATSEISGIYDRASLIALPPEMRRRYARKLIELNQSKAQTLLITLEYDQSILQGPPHSVLAEEVQELFAPDWEISEITRGVTSEVAPKFHEHGIETVIQAVYRLAPHANVAE